MASALYDSVAHHERLLAYQDFVPEEVTRNTHETLEELVKRANKWLESHPDYSVKNCETFNIKVHKHGADHERMYYMRKGQNEDSFILAGRNYYLRCLRIWLIPHLSSSNPSQIGLKTFSPKMRPQRQGHPSKFESLDETVRAMNDSLKMNSVPGSIISVETKPVKFSCSESFDPSKSNWSEKTDERKIFTFVIRVFFLYGSITVETIEFKDFPPEVPTSQTLKINYDTLKGADTFNKLFNKAEEWVAKATGIRVCNMHNIDIKMKISQFQENRQVMSYTEHNERATFFWRALRVVCLTPVQSSSLSVSIQKLSYKTFVPVLLTNKGNFESLVDTFGRIHAWLSVVKRSCHLDIVCIETLPLRFNTGGEKFNGHEAAWTMYKGSRDERWIYVIRVYFDGTFTEPPPNSLPYVPPILEQNTCSLQ